MRTHRVGSAPKVRILLPLGGLLVAVALLAGACGGGGGDRRGDAGVARVGDEVITRAQVDASMSRTERSYELQDRPFPKPSTRDYRLLQQQAVQSLVEKAQLEQKAKELGIEIRDAQVTAQIERSEARSLGGGEKRYEQALKRYGLTLADERDLIRSQLLSEAIYRKVTAGVTVTPAEARAYYRAHAQEYAQAASRRVRHILVETRALAETLYRRLASDGGKSFAALAARYSIDAGSRAQGGELTVLKGQTAPAVAQAAFALRTGGISRPVRTSYGWDVVQALAPAVAARTPPFAQVREQVEETLLRWKRSRKVARWVDAMRKEFAAKTHYRAGFAAATGAAAD